MGTPLEINYYDDGAIVIDDLGRKLEITSGNKKWQEHEGTYIWSINAVYVRAREIKEAETLWDLADSTGDFLWYESRIVEKVKSEQTI